MTFKPRTFHGQAPEFDKESPVRARLEQEVADALASTGLMDASEVEVVAEGSTITLTGFVTLPTEIEDASLVAKSVSGVERVINELTARDREY